MAEPLNKDEIEQALESLSKWKYQDDKLTKEFNFEGFRQAIAFITRISYEADEREHHPEIFNVYNTVKINLTTHDAGDKVTSKDVTLAQSIEAAYEN